MAEQASPPRVAVVAEADTERGAAVAGSLGGAGMTVVLCGADAGALGALADRVEQAGGRAAVFIGDVSDPEVRAVLVEMVDELFAGRPARSR